MNSNASKMILAGAITTILAACGSGGSSSNNGTPSPPTQQTGSVSFLVSDASTEDWATIGVKVLSIALIPQGVGSDVTVYTAPSTVPVINLVQLDQLGELIGNASVPAGTYSGAVVTISANPGDVLLTAASDPSTGFVGTPGATVPQNAIQIQGASGTAPNRTVPVTVNFVSPLTVSANTNNQLDLEFDLSHPVFLIDHTTAAGNDTVWAVNFNGPLRHHPVADATKLVLRHMYGAVTAFDATNTIMTITKEFPDMPITTPNEGYVTSTQSVQISLDTSNGTLFYDMDAKPVAAVNITSFTQAASLVAGQQVRVAARYQQDGTLVATRIYASANFDSVWVSPEGHVLGVDAPANGSTASFTVQNEAGLPIRVQVTDSTEIDYRGTQIAANGLSFLQAQNLARGFKVTPTTDPNTVPMTALSVDIQTAKYDGEISMPSSSSFEYTHKFRTAADDYAVTLDYINSASANGNNPATGAPVTGYKWWNFAYPVSTFDSGTTAIADFVAAAGGAVDFGLASPVPTNGISYVTWADPANASGWSARASILMPSTLPLGTVASIPQQVGNSTTAYTFTMGVLGGTMPATVDISAAAGSATLVYTVSRSNGIVTVTPLDITVPANLTMLVNALTKGTPVKVYGVPESVMGAGSLNAYVLAYFTGEMPSI